MMQIKGHMPYVFNFRGEQYLLYCLGTERASTYGISTYSYVAWSIVYCPLDHPEQVTRLSTTFAPQDIECNPVAYQDNDNDELVVTFSASKILPDEPARYHLYSMRGSDFDSLSNPRELDTQGRPVFNGYSTALYTAWTAKGDTESLYIQRKSGSLQRISALDSILRAVPVPYTESLDTQILITGRQDKYLTLLYDIQAQRILGEIKVTGQSVYKSCITPDKRLIYAKKGKSFEDRRLEISDFELVDTFLEAEVEDITPEPPQRAYIEPQIARSKALGKAIAQDPGTPKGDPGTDTGTDTGTKGKKRKGCSGCRARKAAFKRAQQEREALGQKIGT